MTLNRVQLIGRLGQDPEIRYTRSGDVVANFRMATTERWKGRDGERHEKTEWHSCVAWRAQAELAQNYLKKGSQIYIEGRLETQEWTDNESKKRYRTEIVVSTMRFLDSRDSTDREGADRYRTDRDGPDRDRNAPPPQGDPAPSAAPAAQGEAYLEDDIPF